MEDRLRDVEAAVRHLEHRLASFEARLDAVYRHRGIEAVHEEPARAVSAPAFGRALIAPVISFVGRSLVALGGAFLLRAITDANVVPHAVGIAIGLAYGLFWLWTADRAAPTDRVSATFHGLVAAAIGFPLLWEATVKFDVLSPTSAALGVAAITAGVYVVALRRRLPTIAWIATLAALATAIALIAATAAVLPFALFLVAFGVGTLWVGYSFDWTLLRWPVAAAANLVIVGLTMRVATKTGTESPLAAVLVQLLLLNVYVMSIAIRTLVRARNVNAFEVLQTMAAVAVGFGGAVYLAQLTGVGVLPLAVVNLAAGASCYAIAWVFVASRQGLTRNFYYYTTMAIMLLLVSSRLLLGEAGLALACSVLAVLACVVWHRSGRTAMMWHGAAYLAVAAMASGAMTAAADALVGSAAVTWRPFTPVALVAVAASVICWAIAPRVVFGAVLLWIGSGWLVSLAAPALCGVPGRGANAGAVATVRTTVLATLAFAASWIARRPKFQQTVWLLYALLAAGAIKLLAEDVSRSQPATLFIALAFYGAALIAASRLAHRKSAM